MSCSWSCDHFLFCKRPGWYKRWMQISIVGYEALRWATLLFLNWCAQFSFVLLFSGCSCKKENLVLCGSYYCKVFINWSHWHKIKLLLRQKRPNTFWWNAVPCYRNLWQTKSIGSYCISPYLLSQALQFLVPLSGMQKELWGSTKYRVHQVVLMQLSLPAKAVLSCMALSLEGGLGLLSGTYDLWTQSYYSVDQTWFKDLIFFSYPVLMSNSFT